MPLKGARFFLLNLDNGAGLVHGRIPDLTLRITFNKSGGGTLTFPRQVHFFLRNLGEVT